MVYLRALNSWRENQLNLAHGTKKEKNEEKLKTKKTSSSEEMGQVIVCEAVGEKAVITTGKEFKTQVGFKLAVNERGVMNEQSGESNTWCIELPSRTTACFFQHRLSEIAHQVPATYRLLLNLHTYISWDTCKIGAANNVHVHGKLTSMLRGLILCLIQVYNRIFHVFLPAEAALPTPKTYPQQFN